MRTEESNHLKVKLAQRASWFGIFGNGILAVLKISVGIISGSSAVIGDGIDSASDIVGSLITLYASKRSSEPPDKEHPWGHGRIEAIATKILSMLILFAGLQLIIASLGKFFSGEVYGMPTESAIYVTIFSIFGKGVLAAYKFAVAKTINSSMIRAEAIHMQNDIYISISVLLGLAITFYTKIPTIDLFVGVALGLWIIKSGVELSLETSIELMDSIKPDDEVYQIVLKCIEDTEGVSNPHRLRIRKLNDLYDISLDVEVDGELSVAQGHSLAQDVERNIKAAITNIFDILVHIEPIGNIEDEQFGLSSSDFK